MELIHAIVNGLVVALVITTVYWWRRHRRLGPGARRQDRACRVQQLLIALIAILAILVPVLIVLSSDPGNPDAFRYGP